jgi:hemoglobin
MKDIKLSGPLLQELYSNIGGEDNLEKILDRFYSKMSTDLLIGFFFQDRDIHKIAKMQKAFLMRTWGITSSYQGKPPKEAHAHLAPILTGHFDRRLVLLAETLREFGLSQKWIDVWVSFENRFRDAVQHD